MKAVLLQSGTDLVAEVAELLSAEGSDYSENLVVFPGKRPAHFLRKRIAAERDDPFLPPFILSMDEFVDMRYDERSGKRSSRLEAIDAAALLFEIQRRARGRISKEAFLTADSFFPLGLKIFRDLEELCIEEVPPERLKDFEESGEDDVPEATRGRLDALSLFYEEFYRMAGRLGVSTRSMRYRAVAADEESDWLRRFRKIIFAGFFAFTKSEVRFLRRLFPEESVALLFLEGPGIRERLKELGIEAEGSGPGRPEPSVFFSQSPDSHGQVFAVQGILSRILSGGERLDEKTVIVLPDADTLFPLLRHGIPRLPEKGFNVSIGYPLTRTPLFGFFRSLMQTVLSMADDRVYLPDYLRFVLHPYTKNILFGQRADITRIIFHAMEEELVETKTKAFATLSFLEGEEGLLRSVAKRVRVTEPSVTDADVAEQVRVIHQNTIGRFRGIRNVGEFADRAGEILTFIHDRSTASLHPFFTPYADAFVSSLRTLRSSLLREIAFSDLAGYFTLFRRYLATCAVPFPGTPVRGVQILGFLETRALRFDRVIVLDMNEDVLPGTRKSDSLLPLKTRLALGLPTYHDRDAIVAYYLDTLLKGATEVHCFSVESDRKERSRFVEKLLWERQKRDGETRAERYVRSVAYDVDLGSREPGAVGKDEEVMSALRSMAFSATSLDTYLRCPLRFYHRYVLRLGLKEELSGEIEQREIGSMVHQIIQEFFIPLRGRVLATEDLDEEAMETAVRRVFSSRLGEELSGSGHLLFLQTLRQMRSLVRDYYVPLVAECGVEIRGLEEPVSAGIDGFRLFGRLDMIERRDGRLHIIDVKTGYRPGGLRIRFERLDPDDRETWRDAVGSFQLPLYALLYGSRERMEAAEIESLFLLVGRSRIDRTIELPLFSGGDERFAGFAKIREVLLLLLSEIVDPAVPFTPSLDLKGACPACEFSTICGTRWVGRGR